VARCGDLHVVARAFGFSSSRRRSLARFAVMLQMPRYRADITY